MTSEIKQFKLTNDDDIICEVVEWDDDTTSNIVIRRALKIINVEDFSKGVRFFAFRPWMLFNDDPEELLTINSVHIIGEINPTEALINKYMSSILALINEGKRKEYPLDDIAQKADELDDEEFEAYMYSLGQETTDENVEITYDKDSDDPENVIRLKPRLH